MIWYRHWLEMRRGLLFMAGWWLVLGITIPGPFHSLEVDAWHTWPWEPFGTPLAQMPLAESVGEGVYVWSEFAGRILMFGFAATFTLAGSGLGGLLSPRDASAAYTLTLPVSRTRLVATRLAGALGAVVLAGAFVSAAGAAILIARGHSVPLVPVAQSLAIGVVCAAATLALASALEAVMRYGWTFVTFMLLFILAIVPISYTVAAPGRGEAPWGLLAAFLAIALLAAAVTVYATSARDH